MHGEQVYDVHRPDRDTQGHLACDLEALFEKHDFNAFPVVEAGKMLGIVTKLDFLQAFAFTTSQIVPHFNELMRRTVADVMTEAVVHVEPAAPLTRVLQLMVGLKSRSFPVIGSDGQLVGMISREDVMRALKETTREAQQWLLEELVGRTPN